MKRNRFFTCGRILVLAVMVVSTLFLSSCAEDGFDDESFTSDVTDSTLVSPTADNIKVTPSTDGSTFTISWPVVYGAGGYAVSVLNVNDTNNPVAVDSVNNKTIDGCSVTVKREEDTNYKISVKTLGNTVYNNKDAKTATEKSYSTFTATYMSIPDGANLNEFFASNPLPADSIGKTLNYDLVAGGTYTLSDAIDFGANTVTLRSTTKAENANINFTGIASGFNTSAGLVLKYINFDCNASQAGFIQMSANPVTTPVVISAFGANYNFYFINDPISVIGCKINGLNSFFFWDNKVAVCSPTTLLVKNCLVHCTSSDAINLKNGAYIWTNKGGGFVKDLTINNSTFYNTGIVEPKYFIQYGGFGISQVSTYWTTNSINFDHDTFYNICPNGQWGNYNGIAGKSTSLWNMTNSIFYNCSTSGVARRFLVGKPKQPTAKFDNNTYMKPDGTFDSPAGYDDSGTDIKEDPGFKDAANGDFTISGSKQATLGTGDPRWLPTK